MTDIEPWVLGSGYRYSHQLFMSGIKSYFRCQISSCRSISVKSRSVEIEFHSIFAHRVFHVAFTTLSFSAVLPSRCWYFPNFAIALKVSGVLHFDYFSRGLSRWLGYPPRYWLIAYNLCGFVMSPDSNTATFFPLARPAWPALGRMKDLPLFSGARNEINDSRYSGNS